MEGHAVDEIYHLAAACDRRRRSQEAPQDDSQQALGQDSRWSEPHPDVLYSVMCHLPSLYDRLCLAAVSRRWRAAVRLSLPYSLPRLCLAVQDGRFFAFHPISSVLMPHTSRPGPSRLGSYRGATQGQLLFLTGQPGAYTYSLANPFTGRQRPLPVPSRIRLHEEEIPAADDDDGYYWSEEMPVRKLVVCPDGCLLAAILGHERSAKVALCKPKAAWSWSVGAHNPSRSYADMAFFDGKLYALTNDEDLLALEVGYDNESGEPAISNVERVIDGADCPYTLKEYTQTRYLVVRPRGGGLLIVCKVMMERRTTTYQFLVFQADLPSSRWVEVVTLGDDDEALFVSRLCSRAVSAEHHGVRSDQIFFLDDSTGMEGMGHPLRDGLANVFDMKDGSVTELLPTQPCCVDGAVRATWIFREDADAEE
uniref:Uncharacterized protein n=1 Tax=Avena sativa TaxID=4498 RepID=A0ACD6ADH0_AVESA